MEIENEAELIRAAMAAIGRRKSARKAVASQQNGRLAQSEEARAKMRAAQQARRERDKQAQIASGSAPVETVIKKKPGRPKKSKPDGAETD